jgi:HEAT repeat protein
MLLLSAAGALVPTADAATKTAPPAVSTAAPAALGREAITVLAGRSTDPDPEVRAAVATMWGELGNRGALTKLKKSLADDNPDVRIAAASSMLKLGDVQGLLALIDETKPIKIGRSANPAEELRRMARDAARARAALKLGETGKGAAVEALKNALNDPAGEVRDAAAVALARLGQGDSTQFMDAMKDPDEATRASAARSLGLIGREGLDLLKKALTNDAAVSVRAEAATALGAFNDPASAALLATALADKSGRVRLAAARSLARRDEPASTAALKKLADTAPPAELGLIAAAALAGRGQPADLGLAELTMGQKDPELKMQAIAVLAASDHAETRELLSKAMREDPDPRVRVRAAAATIGRIRREADGGTK